METEELVRVSHASPVMSGGCGCGAIRYDLFEAPFEAGYCHCRLCQRSSGAPVLAFGTVPIGAFELRAGAIGKWASSPWGERWFCLQCGCQIAMRVAFQPDTIDFSLATLDEPELVNPDFHIFVDEASSWLAQDPSLPRYGAYRPGTTGLSQWEDGQKEACFLLRPAFQDERKTMKKDKSVAEAQAEAARKQQGIMEGTGDAGSIEQEPRQWECGIKQGRKANTTPARERHKGNDA